MERLDGDATLRGIDLDPAAEILGDIIRRLAVSVGDHAVPSTGAIMAGAGAEFERDWEACGRPFDRSVLAAATSAAEALVGIDDDLAVNGDLHHDQVLRGLREPWLVGDPVLFRGDIAYDLARCLWWRLDDMGDDRAIRSQLARIARSAGIDHDHAVAAVIFRTVGYWLWGLRNGLTEDPVRCARLLSAVL
ncbi:hypothetical protein GCM10011575_03870 [Microlunatus endophyticus]|uniref:Streptomycin 6-kinase n=1 Tax=Microlunatus endophyticus TaxID=1716077 RepID=A0A917W0Y6_9ACTN|nr:aminoglycoside phosphotransferase family protein [Microlunatus endophyticus]GGL49008.1 hypothetical protein GCM10011575_03870 [Microlunatus endophyticus]